MSPKIEDFEDSKEASALSQQFQNQVADEEVDSSGYQAPYSYWPKSTFPDPRSASLEEIIGGLVSIISVEGPMACHRAYFLYARAVDPPIMRVGGQIRSTFNRPNSP